MSPKTSAQFDPAYYAPVADRITLFFKAYPTGRIVTELVSRTERDVVFKALVYRGRDDAEPAATGWAAEREGDGEINLVACLENAETSAVGRALANLGFTASRERPSAEEMMKANRARDRYGGGVRLSIPRLVREDPVQRHATVVMDLLRLTAAAERAGMRPSRAARWRAALLTSGFAEDRLVEWERRLRAWVARQGW
jgi:hypothetical protein